MKPHSQKFGTGIAGVAAALFATAGASAQSAHYAFVSTTGDDQHYSCLISTPCRTFQYAMKGVVAPLGSEVIGLTGGDFGPIEINGNLSVTFDGGPGMATVSALFGGTAVRISPYDKATVTLRNLRIQGNAGYIASPARIGISCVPMSDENITHKYRSTQLILDHVVIENFNTGISVDQHWTHRLAIADLTVNDCNRGIYVHSTNGLIQTAVQRAHIHNTPQGIVAGNKSFIAVWDSEFTLPQDSFGSGFVVSDDGDGTVMDIDSTLISGATLTGASASGAHSWMHLSNNVFLNNAQAMGSDGGAQLFTCGNNRMTGNQNDGSATATTPLK